MLLLSRLFTSLRNGQKARHPVVPVPYARLSWAVLTALLHHGYLAGLQKEGRRILVVLKYAGDRPAIRRLTQVSTSGHRVYRGAAALPAPAHGLGLVLVSTPKGILSSVQAQEAGVGGEVLCTLF